MRFAFTILLALAFIQFTFADVFSQLQFMKITSPTSGQSIRAGEKVLIKYVMQPLVYSKGHTTMKHRYHVLTPVGIIRGNFKWLCKVFKDQLSQENRKSKGRIT